MSTSTQTTDQQILGGLQTAASHDPDPTQISQGILAVASKIVSIFSQAHSKALAREASTINAALPTYLSEMSSVIDGLNQGALSKEQALAYVQQAESDYYTTVAGINNNQSKDCTVSADGISAGTANKYHCSTTAGKCNAACCLGCNIVEPTTRGMILAINNNGGRVVVQSTPNNGAIQGTRSIVFEYAPQGAVLQGVDSFLSLLGVSTSEANSNQKNSPLILLAVLALLVFFLVKK